MDLRSLRYFVEVAGTGNFSRAAVRLHRTQPAVSRCISELEAELGLRLFDRIGRRASLTPSGRSLLERSHKILAETDGLAEHARLLAAGKAGVLHVGAVPNMIERVLPSVLSAYAVRFPDVEVMLRPDGGTELLKAVEHGDVDVAIGRHVQSPTLDAKPVFPFYVLAVVPRTHPLARKPAVTVSDLATSRILIAPPIMASRALFDAACHESRVRTRIALESVEYSALIALAAANQGVAVVPSTATTAMKNVRVVPIFHEGRPLGSWAALVWDKRKTLSIYAKGLVATALEMLRKDYPGKNLRLPPPPLDKRLLRASESASLSAVGLAE